MNHFVECCSSLNIYFGSCCLIGKEEITPFKIFQVHIYNMFLRCLVIKYAGVDDLSIYKFSLGLLSNLSIVASNQQYRRSRNSIQNCSTGFNNPHRERQKIMCCMSIDKYLATWSTFDISTFTSSNIPYFYPAAYNLTGSEVVQPIHQSNSYSVTAQSKVEFVSTKPWYIAECLPVSSACDNGSK